MEMEMLEFPIAPGFDYDAYLTGWRHGHELVGCRKHRRSHDTVEVLTVWYVVVIIIIITAQAKAI